MRTISSLSIKLENYVLKVPVLFLCAAWTIVLFSYAPISEEAARVAGKAFIEQDLFPDIQDVQLGGVRGKGSWKYPEGAWIGTVKEGFPVQGTASYLLEFTGPAVVPFALVAVHGLVSQCVKDVCQPTPNPRAVVGAQVGAWNFATRGWDLLGVARSLDDSSSSQFKLRAESPEARGGTHLLDLGSGRHRAIIRLWFESGDASQASRYDVESITLVLK
jgi:hypothetical protein